MLGSVGHRNAMYNYPTVIATITASKKSTKELESESCIKVPAVSRFCYSLDVLVQT